METNIRDLNESISDSVNSEKDKGVPDTEHNVPKKDVNNLGNEGKQDILETQIKQEKDLNNFEEIFIKEEPVETEEAEQTNDILYKIKSFDDIKKENVLNDNEICVKIENVSGDEVDDFNKEFSLERIKVEDESSDSQASKPLRNQGSEMSPVYEVPILQHINLSQYNTQNSSNNTANDQTDDVKCHDVRSSSKADDIKNKQFYIYKGTGVSRTLKLSDNFVIGKHFICDLCKRLFYKKSILTDHIFNHPQIEKNQKCPHCPYNSLKKSDLDKHVNAVHTKNKSFDCSFCSYKSYQKSVLNNHINAKHTKSKIFKCPSCVFECFDRANITRHVKAMHIKNEVFNCSFCSYKTYRKGSLSQHIKTKHTKSTVFKCTFCIYQCFDKSNLNRHINAKHTKTTVYKCEFCSYETDRKSYITRHTNAKHV